MNFDVVKKGYNKDQVNEYIQTITNENNNIITNLKSEIDELKKQKDELTQIVEGYEKKKNEIFVAFVEAQESSAKLKARAEKRFDAEMERLQLFIQKWTSYAKQVTKTLTPEQAENFEVASQKFEEILSAYAKEVKVLQPEQTAEKSQKEKAFDPLKKVEKFLNKFVEEQKPIQPEQKQVSKVVVPQVEQEVCQVEENIFEQPLSVEVEQTEVVEKDDFVVTKAPLELEDVAEELVDVKEIENIVVQEPQKQENIKEKVEKLFEEDSLQFENNDIQQNEIFNVQQSLEDLCKELGLMD